MIKNFFAELRWGASWPRALAETLLFAACAWLALLWLNLYGSTILLSSFVAGTVIITPICALYSALRLRLPEGSWLRQLWLLALFAAALCAGLSLTLLAIFLVATLLGDQPFYFNYMNGLVVPACLALTAPGFVFFHAAARLWSFWDGLQRRYLIWSLTHAHLVLVVLLSLLFALFLTSISAPDKLSNYIDNSVDDPFSAVVNSLIITIVPLVGVFLVVAGVLLVVVLPPSAIFSYIVSGRTTRRLSKLTAATAAIRSGYYGARVPIEGEDEVAQLQVGFNEMSGALETAVRQLRAERDTVEALSQSRRELVAGVSHELRTPVATLRGYIESTLANRAEEVPADVRHDLEVMEGEVVRLQRLIDDLFTFSRVDSGKLPLKLGATDVGALAQRLVDTAAPLVWRSSKVEVVADVPAGLPPAIADPGRLEQVLSNLLHNAVRYTAAGGLVGVMVSATPSDVLIQVRDTGTGIAPEDLPRIFERFYRAGGASNPQEGAGLGLALVKELTEAMGGSIEVVSAVGEGSCFTVCLRRA